MRNEKKLHYQEQQIKSLQKHNKELQQEISTLNSQFEVNKKSILLREKALKDKEKQVEETKIEYDRLLAEIKEMFKKHEANLAAIDTLKKNYEKEMKQHLRRIRKQK